MKKRLFSMLLVLTLMFGLLVPCMPAQAATYSDVRTSDWFYDAVNYVSDNNLFSGTGGGMFSPNTTITRAMFVTVLGRFAGVSPNAPTGNHSFDDVQDDDYFAPYVNWADEIDVASGYTTFIFGSDFNISREDLVTMLHRYALYIDHSSTDISYINNSTLSKFVDNGYVKTYADMAMIWAVESGVINGKDGNRLDPQGLATRAEAAQIFKNFSELLGGSNVVMGSWTEVNSVNSTADEVLATLPTGGSTAVATIDALYDAYENLQASGEISNLSKSSDLAFTFDYADGVPGLVEIYADFSAQNETTATSSSTQRSSSSTPSTGITSTTVSPVAYADSTAEWIYGVGDEVVPESATLRIYEQDTFYAYSADYNSTVDEMISAAQSRGLDAKVQNLTVDSLKSLGENGISILSFPHEESEMGILINDKQTEAMDKAYADELMSGRMRRTTFLLPAFESDYYGISDEMAFEAHDVYSIDSVKFFSHYYKNKDVFNNSFLFFGFNNSDMLESNNIFDNSGDLVMLSTTNNSYNTVDAIKLLDNMTDIFLDRGIDQYNSYGYFSTEFVLNYISYFNTMGGAGEYHWWKPIRAEFDYVDPNQVDQLMFLYPNGTIYNLSDTPADYNGEAFSHWEMNGDKYYIGDDVELETENVTFTAVYGSGTTTPPTGETPSDRPYLTSARLVATGKQTNPMPNFLGEVDPAEDTYYIEITGYNPTNYYIRSLTIKSLEKNVGSYSGLYFGEPYNETTFFAPNSSFTFYATSAISGIVPPSEVTMANAERFNYFNFPIALIGYHGYSTPTYGIQQEFFNKSIEDSDNVFVTMARP